MPNLEAVARLSQVIAARNKGRVPPPVPVTARTDCLHRSDTPIDTVTCGTCKGRVELKIYACETHGACTVATRADGVPGVCKGCRDYWPKTVIVDQGGNGIGDGLLGLLATSGYKRDYPAARLVYNVGPAALPWVQLFDGYDALGTHYRDHNTGPVPGAVQMNAGWHHEWHSKFRDTAMWERYCANIGASDPVLPALREPDRVRALGAAYAGAVFLCPFSHSRSREWPLASWTILESLLRARGVRTVICHSGADRCEAFAGELAAGFPPDRLAGAFLNAALVIGNDSGPAHLAGVLGVPALAVVGDYPGHRLYGAYPRVTCVQGGGGLHTVTPEMVLAAAGEALAGLDVPCAPMAGTGQLTATAFAEDYYEQHRRAGLDYMGHGAWQEGYGRWFVEALGLAGKSVLDVGCACGSIACGFAKAGAVVSGCDVNEHMVTKGRARWLAGSLKVCDAANLHYWADGTFDFIHSAQVFEHLKPELVPHVLAECWRVTKPGGALFVCLDTAEMYARQGRDPRTEDATHTCVQPMAWWDALLARTGWAHAPDLLAKLTAHPGSYFREYDWDCFVVRKTAARV